MKFYLETNQFVSTSFDDILKFDYDAVFPIIDDLIKFKDTSKIEFDSLWKLEMSFSSRALLNNIKDKPYELLKKHNSKSSLYFRMPP